MIWSRELQHQSYLYKCRSIYNVGYAWQVILVVLSDITLIPVQELLIFVSPMMGSFLIVFTFIAYRELTGDLRLAFFSSLLLGMQPELLFAISRGNYEKLYWFSFLLILFCLARSRFKQTNCKKSYIIPMFMSSYLFISANVLLTFLFLIILASLYFFDLAITLLARFSKLTIRVRAFSLTFFLAFFVIYFTHTFYVYKPSEAMILTLNEAWTRFSSFSLFKAREFTQVTHARSAYSDSLSFLLLNIFNIVMLPTSLLAFLASLRQFTNLTYYWKLIVAGYVSSLIIFGLSVYGDLAVAIRGGNVELRVIPMLMIFAVPLVCRFLRLGRSQIKRSQSKLKIKALSQVPMVLAITMMMVFAITTPLKITSEISMTTVIPFYTEHEKTGLVWINRHVGSEIIHIDFRLFSVFQIFEDLDTHYYKLIPRVLTPIPLSATMFFVSDLMIERGSMRLLTSTLTPNPLYVEYIKIGPWLSVSGEYTLNSSLVYSNGGAIIYYVKPHVTTH